MTKLKQSYVYSGIEWLEQTDSTNLDVRRNLDKLDNLSVIAARVQTAGRGQGDHHWVSPKDENLTFSMLLRFGEGALERLDSSQAVRITQMATVAVRSFLLSEGVSARIKWPNDIWVGPKKICGMLIENILEGTEIAASIVGIGLNLNQRSFDPTLPNPVSLSQLTGKTYGLRSTLESLYKVICRHASMLNDPAGRSELEKVFEQNLFHLDKSARENFEESIASFEEIRRLQQDQMP